MKIRSLLTVVAIVSLFLFGIGTAYAVTGVNDAVPGQDVVFPIICEGVQPNTPAGDPVGGAQFGTLNTVWAIAETSGPSCVADDSVCAPDPGAASSVGVVQAFLEVYDRRSVIRLDIPFCWSAHDVISDHCQGVINLMDPASRDAMEVVINGVTYFAGYAYYRQTASCTGAPYNTFASWVYINDIAAGFASGINGVSLENGGGSGLQETCESTASCSGLPLGVTAHTVFPRYFILNDDLDTFNWWIFLLGRNEYAVEETFGRAPANNIHRQLSCFFCDEQEHCISNGVPIPYELNILRVQNYIPGGIFPPGVFPKAGFAYCTVDEHGFITGGAEVTIAGTLTNGGLNYSLFGWSYQRAIPVLAQEARVAATHEVHRLYCSADSTGDNIPNRFATAMDNTVLTCTMTGSF